MPNATTTSTAYNGTIINQNTFTSAIDTGMVESGWTLADSNTIGIRTYTMTAGTFTLSLVMTIGTNAVVSYNIYTTSSSSTSASLTSTFSYTSGHSITILTIAHPEIRGILITQNTVTRFYGAITPANKKPWYPTNVPWAFMYSHDNGIFNPSSGQTTFANPFYLIPPLLAGTTIEPHRSNLTNMTHLSNVVNNLNSNTRDVSSIVVYDSLGRGIIGWTSPDLVGVCAVGLTSPGVDTIVVGSVTYLYIDTQNRVTTGLAIRIA